MGTYSWEELVRRWQTGELTVEQAIGQLLQLFMELAARVRELERWQFADVQGNGETGEPV